MSEHKQQLSDFSYRGARAMIILHDRQLRVFYRTWLQGVSLGRSLPSPGMDYESWEELLQHLLSSSRMYLFWLCDKLVIIPPALAKPPELPNIARDTPDYLDQLFEAWSLPFSEIPEEKWDQVFKSNWDIDYCLDAMLEHAVMHPMRHSFQIEEWIERNQSTGAN